MHAMYRFNPFHHHFSFCKAKKDWSVASLALTRRKQFFEKIYMTVIQQAVIVKNERCCLFIHMRSTVKIKISFFSFQVLQKSNLDFYAVL